MLTIEIHTEGSQLAVHLKGHAGAGKWGQDIVCAAASILTYTAAASASQLYRQGQLSKRPRTRLEPGNAHIQMENCPAARQLLDVIATGFALLAVRYPKNVCLIRK